MKRNTLNFLTDGITALVMLAMIATGLLVRFVLPPGSGGRLSVWGWGRHDWGDAHFWLAVALGGLIVLHVTLHWAWVCGTVHRLCSRGPVRTARTPPWQRHLAGGLFLVTIISLVGGFLWAAGRSVYERPDGHGRSERSVRASLVAPPTDLPADQSGRNDQRRQRGGR